MAQRSEQFWIDRPADEVRATCRQAVLAKKWSITHQDDHSLTCKEPIGIKLLTKDAYPATIQVLFTEERDGTSVTLNASCFGLGPSIKRHLRVETAALREELGGAVADDSLPPIPSALPAQTEGVASTTAASLQGLWRSAKKVYEEASSPAPAPTTLGTASSSDGGKHIFISYRRSDSGDVTGRIYDRLVARFGKESIFKDVDDIPLGVDYRKVLEQTVGQCQVVLAIIGREWVDIVNDRKQRRLDDPSDPVRAELELALERDIPVIPILVRDSVMPHADELPESIKPLAYRNGVAVRRDPDFGSDIERLVEGLNRHLS